MVHENWRGWVQVQVHVNGKKNLLHLQAAARAAVGKGERLHGVRKAVNWASEEIVIFLLFSFLPSLQQESHHSHCPRARSRSRKPGRMSLHCLCNWRSWFAPPSLRVPVDRHRSLAVFFPRLLVGCLRQPRLTKNSSTWLCEFVSWRVSCTPSPFHHFWAPTWTANDSCLVT